ncbi:hypothetical protein K2173_017864 [Erythroxylum novogranatense]|uniref:Myb-like domain-containing protein n=1 Tax=Erythroxylum novogranatense TaxID=1862640 RepID=A0AAV8T244_9ROSI|nr:hypothetical protein K2173_017864 [Erythroxylum novogranatense]
MFEGVPDQFHQFITSRAPPSLSNFPPLHVSSTTHHFPSFDPYISSTTSSSLQVPFLQPLHQCPVPATSEQGEKEENGLAVTGFEVGGNRLMPESVDPWSNDEVLALLRVRSSLENWFPEFSWEHVSRKLAELGFRRSADKCKEKFEEENRYFNNNINYRIFTDLGELYHDGDDHQSPQEFFGDDNKDKKVDKPNSDEEEDKVGQILEEDSIDDQRVAGNPNQDNEKQVENLRSNNKKRKRQIKKKKFAIFKSFCEDIVDKLMTQQEEMHNKIISDMMKRDEENVAREEAWKKQELDRINKLRADEQALARERQSTIMKYLKRFTPIDSSVESLGERSAYTRNLGELSNSSTSASTSSSLVFAQNPTDSSQANNPSGLELQTRSNLVTRKANQAPENFSSSPISSIPKVPNASTKALALENPSYKNTPNNPLAAQSPLPTDTTIDSKSSANDKKDLGKRWPRDEVLALINIRCSFHNNIDQDKEVATPKGPLWERISQGMLELGYKRSAKRCKEKWENINKYFRKTKDVRKKRSADSSTCPYFHQLSTLYKQGTALTTSVPSEEQEGRLTSPKTQSSLPEMKLSSPLDGWSSNATTHLADDQGERTMVQKPDFDFEF